MAFTRKALKDMGIPDDQIDSIMTLHGTSMSDYLPKSQIDDEVKKKLGDADIESLKTKAAKADDLEKQLGGIKFDYALSDHLKSKGVAGDKAMKAVRALLDPEKIKLDGEKLTGIDEQLDELTKDESVAALFKKTEETPPAKPAFGAAPKGSAPDGQAGTNFADFMSFVPKKK